MPDGRHQQQKEHSPLTDTTPTTLALQTAHSHNGPYQKCLVWNEFTHSIPFYSILFPNRPINYSGEGNDDVGITGDAEPHDECPNFSRNPNAFITAQLIAHIIIVRLQLVGKLDAVLFERAVNAFNDGLADIGKTQSFVRINLRLDSCLFELFHLAADGVSRSVGIRGGIVEPEPCGVHVRLCLD